MPLFACVLSPSLWAMDKGMRPGMIALGPLDLIPLLDVAEKYDDNIFNNDLNKKDSLVTQIKGGGELALRRKLDRYALQYSFLSSQYHNSPADDYVDHNLSATTHFDMTRRHRLDVKSSLVYGHNMRGTFFSQGETATQINEPDQFHRYDAGFSYRYGGADARGNLGLELDWYQVIYDNHRDRTAQRDRTQLVITPGFYYRLMPKTYLTTEIQNTVVDYLQNPADPTVLVPSDGSAPISLLDYTQRRYLVGVTWELSSQTKGTLRAGYLQQEFSGGLQPSISGLTWDGQAQWQPLSHDSFDIGLSRGVQPSIGNGVARQLQSYQIGWTHQWPHRVSSRLSGSYQEVVNQGLDQAQVRSSGLAFRIDVKYQMRSWLNVGINYLKSNFQAETNDTASSKNVFMLYVQSTF